MDSKLAIDARHNASLDPNDRSAQKKTDAYGIVIDEPEAPAPNTPNEQELLDKIEDIIMSDDQ